MPDDTGSVDLPFGRTTATAAELAQQADQKTACSLLAENGTPDPTRRLSLFFQQVPELLQWLEANGRHFPWRNTTDPWRVYLSEILLQRTRAEAVNELYGSFFEQFPHPEALHQASDEEIHSLIQTLGFGNQRTRTLNEVAELVVTEHGGEVPQSLEELQRPWRVGPYSARATMLFAYGEPLALVDTNFARVTERVFGYEMPTQPHKSDEVYQLLDALVPAEPALCRSVNLALLDLADAICTPSEPRCDVCPLAEGCLYASPGE
ncbi:hypothetical protein [Haloglomus salinum]|uniref:hypothetical protein n=1 Tax=Haloglomus salinum TaxID=2962673 RepID=UPI0020C99844|nr:hypothetical protein [Haloglomus salinum]